MEMANLKDSGAVAFVVFMLLMLSKGDSDVNGKRTLKTMYNPGCGNECDRGSNDSAVNLVYVRAQGDHDVLHYIMSSIGVPTILVIKTEGIKNNVEIKDWKKFLSDENAKSITVTGNVEYSFATMFPRMYEYNDTKDYANMSKYDINSTDWLIHEFMNFTWEAVPKASLHNNSAVFNATMNSTTAYQEHDIFINNGSLSFNFQSNGHHDRNLMLPHLEYNENITQLDLTIDNLMPAFRSSRYGVEILMAGETKDDMMWGGPIKSIDDEYSPGVFSMNNWITKPKQEMNNGFLQWKPVCYTMKERSRKSGTAVMFYDLKKREQISDVDIYLKHSIAYAFYGDVLLHGNMSVTGSNVSFGLTEDGAYDKTNYTVWSASVGYGFAPKDVISLLVIVVISCGLGLPVIVIVIGSIFVCMRKRNERS